MTSSTPSDTNPQGERKHSSHLGCGILGRYPVISILIFAAVGIAAGVGLSFWIPETEEEQSQKNTALKWIGLLGDLFIRALKCVILPLVFVNVAISVVEMMNVGKASSIGWRTIGMYLLTTVIAATFGVIAIAMFLGYFQSAASIAPGPPLITLGCTQDELLIKGSDGSVFCSADVTSPSDAQFIIDDVSGTFVTKSSGPANDISLSDTFYDGVFKKLVSANIFESFVDGNFAAVVFFAIIFGIALAQNMKNSRRSGNEKESSTVMSFLQEVDGILMQMILWVIMVTPFAVLSLITKAIGSQDDLKKEFANVGYLVVAACVGFLLHFVFVDIILFGALTKSNPFSYLKHLIPCQTMAFACASSAATIPVTLQCVQSTGKVPEQISKFVVPLGATINMDGSAIYIPIACVWMAALNGITPNVGQYVLLIILATIGSAGAAPVPSSSLVLILTAYNTVFNQVGTPFGFSFILAIDWFLDRFRTALNVTGDSVVSAIVSHSANAEELKGLSVDKDIEGVQQVDTYEGEQPGASPLK